MDSLHPMYLDMLKDVGIPIFEVEDPYAAMAPSDMETPKDSGGCLLEGTDDCFGLVGERVGDPILAFSYEQLHATPMKTSYPYKRLTYFKTCLQHFQAIQHPGDTPIPPLPKLPRHIDGVYDVFRRWCKKQKRSDLYTYIPYLIIQAGGPQWHVTSQQYQALCQHFRFLEYYFDTLDFPRTYFLHYPSIITSLCHLLNIPLPYSLPIVKHPKRFQTIQSSITHLLHEYHTHMAQFK